MILQLLLKDAESYATHSVRMQKQRSQFVRDIVSLYNDKYNIAKPDSLPVRVRLMIKHSCYLQNEFIFFNLSFQEKNAQPGEDSETEPDYTKDHLGMQELIHHVSLL